MKPQVTSGKSNTEDTPHQKPAPNTQQASIPQKFDLNDLIGDNLIDANGNPIDSATLKNKFIGIYFSAHWCGPCRQFTPKLVEFRNQIADEFEVVFASADQDAPAMLSYMKEAAMPWPALPFASPKISSLNRTFQIRSIPTFVVLDPTGRLASPNARNDVTTLSPKDALSKWKIDAEKAAPPKPALVPPPVLSSTSENPPKDTSIVPGKSLLGCPIGSTEEEVVKKLGKPMANFRFGENATALLYYNGTALLRFHNGKLLDGNFSGSSQLRINHFHKKEAPAYSLPNGIAIGTDLQELKDVLGNKVDIKNINESSDLSYLDEGLMIKLQYTKHTIHVNGNKTIQYKIDSIQIENPNSPFGFKSIDPGKSIFGCPLGASEAEIIKILGEHQGKIDLGQNKIGLLYDNFCNLLILWDGVLGGGVFKSRPIFGNDLYRGNNMVTFTNGIALGASLAKAKEILGEKFDASQSLHNITFQEGDSLVTIHSYRRIPNGVSHEEAAKDINNYTINSIQIDPISKAQTASPSTGCAIPKKTTFPARQNPEAFNPAEMVAVEGGTLSEKSNLPGVKVDSFFIGKYEVTNAEWLAIQTFAQMNGYSFSKDPRTDHPEMPVEGVTRRGAMLWCNAKSEKEGRKPVYWLNGKVYKSPDQEPEMNLDADGYRLPTEPEWEWAARGGIQSKGYEFSGSNIQNEVAWHGDDGEKWARLVGTKKPNELGIHDMSGNVYEWVWDINIPTHGIQGGSYMSGKWHLILNHRNSSPLRDFANEVGSARSLGFRVARNHSKESKPPITPVSYQTIPDHSASGPEQPTVPKVDLLSLIGKELFNDESQISRQGFPVRDLLSATRR
jgi:formylglycine-generating enzyme required for sulfatase activity/thiol-disulfide isomerase/thioredoxin